MTQDVLRSYARTEPFRPFRLTLSTGSVLDVRHPDLIMVGYRAAVVGISKRVGGTAFDRTVHVDLIHIVTAEEFPEPNTPSNGTDTMTA